MGSSNWIDGYQAYYLENGLRPHESSGFRSAIILSLSGLVVLYTTSYNKSSFVGHVETFLWLPGFLLCAVIMLRKSVARDIGVSVITVAAVLFFLAYHIANRHEIARYPSDVSTAIDLLLRQQYRRSFLQAYHIVWSIHFLYWLFALYWIVKKKLSWNQQSTNNSL